jgi:hypothetical protein
MLHINPKMVPRLNELQADLEERRDRAVAEGWVGEIEVIELTLRFLRDGCVHQGGVRAGPGLTSGVS